MLGGDYWNCLHLTLMFFYCINRVNIDRSLPSCILHVTFNFTHDVNFPYVCEDKLKFEDSRRNP